MWAPPPGTPPKSIVHLLGGAFAGAAPAPAYGLLAGLIADGGHTVIATPYPATFRHADAARDVTAAFWRVVGELRAGENAWAAPAGLPTHGVGHSMGALLHLLASSSHATGHASTVLLSYNNRPVSDAVPVPLDSAAGAARSVLAAARGAAGGSLPKAGDLLTAGLAALAGAGVSVPAGAAAALGEAAPALDQLAAVTGEVGDGVAEFDPPPAESRRIIQSGYRVPRTYLVAFSNDTIDESPSLAALLRGAGSTNVTFDTLPGTHVTPCGGDVSWAVGAAPSALDLLALGGRAVLQADARRLAARVVGWLDGASGSQGALGA